MAYKTIKTPFTYEFLSDVPDKILPAFPDLVWTKKRNEILVSGVFFTNSNKKDQAQSYTCSVSYFLGFSFINNIKK